MYASSRVAAPLILAPLIIMFGWTAPMRGAQSADAAAAPEAVMLVARPQFQDPLYGETILIAKSLEGGRHVGFILNRPTQFALSDAFPEHGNSKLVRDPLYLGGPDGLNTVFALVTSRDSPGNGSMQLGPDLYLVIAAETVGRLIETADDHARFFVGAVLWQPGELNEELRLGAWYVFEPQPDLVLPKKTAGLWQELVRRAQFRERAI
jgi:putative transcriptional regulator